MYIYIIYIYIYRYIDTYINQCHVHNIKQKSTQQSLQNNQWLQSKRSLHPSRVKKFITNCPYQTKAHTTTITK